MTSGLALVPRVEHIEDIVSISESRAHYLRENWYWWETAQFVDAKHSSYDGRQGRASLREEGGFEPTAAEFAALARAAHGRPAFIAYWRDTEPLLDDTSAKPALSRSYTSQACKSVNRNNQTFRRQLRAEEDEVLSLLTGLHVDANPRATMDTFLRVRCEPKADHRVMKILLFDTYTKWMAERGDIAHSREWFDSRMSGLGHTPKRRADRFRFWEGLKLR